MELRRWLVNLPCVKDGRVKIDVRGPWPLAIIGSFATRIESRDDFAMFISEHLD